MLVNKPFYERLVDGNMLRGRESGLTHHYKGIGRLNLKYKINDRVRTRVSMGGVGKRTTGRYLRTYQNRITKKMKKYGK